MLLRNQPGGHKCYNLFFHVIATKPCAIVEEVLRQRPWLAMGTEKCVIEADDLDLMSLIDPRGLRSHCVLPVAGAAREAKQWLSRGWSCQEFEPEPEQRAHLALKAGVQML